MRVAVALESDCSAGSSNLNSNFCVGDDITAFETLPPFTIDCFDDFLHLPTTLKKIAELDSWLKFAGLVDFSELNLGHLQNFLIK